MPRDSMESCAGAPDKTGKQYQPRHTPMRRATLSSSQFSGTLRVLPAISAKELYFKPFRLEKRFRQDSPRARGRHTRHSTHLDFIFCRCRKPAELCLFQQRRSPCSREWQRAGVVAALETGLAFPRVQLGKLRDISDFKQGRGAIAAQTVGLQQPVLPVQDCPSAARQPRCGLQLLYTLLRSGLPTSHNGVPHPA